MVSSVKRVCYRCNRLQAIFWASTCRDFQNWGIALTSVSRSYNSDWQQEPCRMFNVPKWGFVPQIFECKALESRQHQLLREYMKSAIFTCIRISYSSLVIDFSGDYPVAIHEVKPIFQLAAVYIPKEMHSSNASTATIQKVGNLGFTRARKGRKFWRAQTVSMCPQFKRFFGREIVK